MTQTLGSSAPMKWDRPTDRLTPEQFDRNVVRVLELLVEVRRLWEQAVDGGVYTDRLETNGRGKGFHDSDPTYSAARAPTKIQLRGSARYAAILMAECRERLEDAARVLHNGLLRTDPEVLEDFLEKRRAATQE